jgi:molybdopterin-guanine dinucleotide biosynthesis protein A
MTGATTGGAPGAAMAPLAAAILTGGRASRMGGTRKATLALGGESIIERQLAVLTRVATHVFLVTSAQSPLDANLRVVRDEFPDHGALGGIYTAIVASPHERTLVVACDMPFLSRALLEHMAGIDADVVIPRTARGYEPLCAIYGRACIAPMRARLTRGELEASRLLEGVRVAEVGPEALAAYDPDGLLFVNVNTPHDYERAKEVLEERSKASRDRIMDELGP